MKAINEMTQVELAAWVQVHLRKKGIEVVLSGGAAVSYYSEGKYVSMDVDLVDRYSSERRVLREAMQELGFIEEGRHFRHPNNPYFVEFPPGPLSIGQEPVKEINEVQLSTGLLRIISPTECVKDRLAAYYHWGDRQALVQAGLVAKEHKIDMEEVRRWSQVEGNLEEFEKVRDKLAGKA